MVTVVPLPTELFTLSLSINDSITENPRPERSSSGAVVKSGVIACFTSDMPQPVSLMRMYISLSGSSLGLDRSALKSYAELGFSGGAGPLGNHIGVLVEDATKPLSLGTSPTVPSDTAPHIDELTIEDAFMEYNPDAGYAYKCPLYVKIRFDFYIPPEHPLI